MLKHTIPLVSGRWTAEIAPDRGANPIRVQYGGEDYVLLAPVDPTEDMEDDEVLVLKIDNDENGEEIYVSVEEDGVVEKVFEKYLELVEAEDDGEN